MKERGGDRGFRRAVPLALFWIVIQSSVSGYMHGTSIGQIIANHLSMGGMFYMMLLVFIVNPLLHRISPQLAFTPREWTILWAMIAAASAVPGYGFMEFLFPYLAAPLYFATPENQWRETVLPHLPSWVYVTDPKAVQDFFVGLREGEPVPWAAWTKPALFAMALGLAFYLLVYCWAALLRRVWVEQERYSFPLVQVAYHLTHQESDGHPLNATLRHPLFWTATGITVVVHLLNGIHNHIPTVPHIPVDFTFAPFFTTKPWNRLVEGWPLWPHIYFSVIGVTYFLHLDVALSLWLFFTLYKFEEVAFSAFSITTIDTQDHVMGAVVVLALSSVYGARRHLANVFRAVVHGQTPSVSPREREDVADDSDEPMSYRASVGGLLAGFGILGIMHLLLGMSLWLIVLYLILMVFLATVGSWHVSNAGLLLVNVGFGPLGFFRTFFGDRFLGPRNLVVLGYDRNWIPNWSDETLMPMALQTFRLAGMHRLDARSLHLPRLAVVSVLLATAVAYFVSLWWIYRRGANTLEPWIFTGIGRDGLNRANAGILNPSPPDLSGILSAGIGGLVMAFLLVMRHQFLWWPLHPLGFALGVTWAPFHLWFSTMIGWALKLVMIRFGGLGLYQKGRPFFVGLILGEYFMTAIWSFVGLFTRVSYWGLPH